MTVLTKKKNVCLIVLMKELANQSERNDSFIVENKRLKGHWKPSKLSTSQLILGVPKESMY